MYAGSSGYPRSARLLAALVLAAIAGCGRTETLDLVARLDGAELQHESALIDFGTPAAREHLAAGWGADEKWGEASFVWALGEKSSVDFYVGVPRPLTLRMRCWPLPLAGLPPQTVAVAVNGTALGTLSLRPEQAEYSLAVPAAALQPGVNRLDFQYAYARRPVDLDPNQRDPRPLAVAWDWLAFDGLTNAAAPSTPMNGTLGELALPANSAASFYLDLPDGGVLEIGDILPAGGGSNAALEVEAQAADGGSPVATRFESSGTVGGQHWTIPAQGLLRLTFRPPAGASGVRVVLPTVRRAIPPPTPACKADTAVPGAAGAPVLIYLIDTLRADHLGCYGYPRAISPHIDAFARDAVRFAHTMAQSSWTKPSVASILTGLTPRRHGANGRRDVLRPVRTLAAALAGAGYFTQGIVTNSVVAADFGFAQGFADYHLLEERPLAAERGVDAPPGALIHQGADALRRAAETWLDGHGAAPFFLYLHASDPHDPYVPPAPFRERWAAGVDPRTGFTGFLERILSGQYTPTAGDRNGLIALYDAEIAFVDQEFGALLDDLRQRGLYDRALIVLVADHGEAFNEHGRWHHGTTLFHEETAVPLLIKFPHQWNAGVVVDGRVQHVDIAPTILATLGLPPAIDGDGRSLLATLACPATGPPPPVYEYLGGGGFGVELESITVGDRKLFHVATADRPRRRLELFDLAHDPTEEHDVSAAHPIEAGYLLSLMAPYRRHPPAPDRTKTPVDPAVLERLRALGYGRGS